MTMWGLGVYALVLGALLVATWRSPAAAIAGLLCVQVLDFWGQLWSPLLVEYGLFTNIYVVGLLGLGIVRAWFAPGPALHGIPHLRVVLIVFWLYAALSLLWSMARHDGLLEWGKYWPYIISTGLMVPLLLREEKDLDVGLRWLAVIGAALVVLVDVFVTWSNRYIVSFYSSSEMFWNALAFAQLAGYVAIAVILLNFPRNVLWLAGRGLVTLACLVLAVKSGTRGQFALMILVPLALLPLSLPMKSPRSYLSAILLAAVIVGGSIWAFDRFSTGDSVDDDQRWSTQKMDSDWSLRAGMATRLLAVWWDRAANDPAVLFAGLGNSSAFAVVGFYPHMLVAEVLAEEGIVGSVLLVTLLVLLARRWLMALRQTSGRPNERSVVVTVAAMFLFAFILSFKQGSLAGFTAEVFLFGVLLEQQVRIAAASRTSEGVSPASAVAVAAPLARPPNLLA